MDGWKDGSILLGHHGSVRWCKRA